MVEDCHLSSTAGLGALLLSRDQAARVRILVNAFGLHKFSEGCQNKKGWL